MPFAPQTPSLDGGLTLPTLFCFGKTCYFKKRLLCVVRPLEVNPEPYHLTCYFEVSVFRLVVHLKRVLSFVHSFAFSYAPHVPFDFRLERPPR